jgi:hypothetical protein
VVVRGIMQHERLGSGCDPNGGTSNAAQLRQLQYMWRNRCWHCAALVLSSYAAMKHCLDCDASTPIGWLDVCACAVACCVSQPEVCRGIDGRRGGVQVGGWHVHQR